MVMSKSQYLNSNISAPFISRESNTTIKVSIASRERNGNLKSLYFCLNPNAECKLGDISMQFIAYAIHQVGSYLTASNATLEMYESYSTKSLAAPFFVDIIFMPIGFIMIFSLMEEKLKGIKFSLFMSGVSKKNYYMGSLGIPLIFATLYSILVVILTTVSWRVTDYIAPLTVLVFATSYSYVAFFWFISIFSSKTQSAMLMMTIFIIGGFITSSLQNIMLSSLSSSILLLMCINPRVGLSLFHYIVDQYRIKGFSWISVPYFAPSVLLLTIASITGMLFWFILAIFASSLEVSEDERKPFFSGFKRKILPIVKDSEIINPKIEPHHTNLPEQQQVIIRNVSKVYENSNHMALKNVSIEFCKDEIFGLLGYNGAGKSTLINILTGVISSTEGSVTVFGLDASKDRAKIAKRTGFCSQNDILYDDLTFKEHLYFYGIIRGLDNEQVEQYIRKVADELDLDEKILNSQTLVLSGGEKRKLGVALAFIHDPELVVLDEMSSGVDPENRRAIWSFLMQNKKEKAILMCTHFMDEADILADRKAILNNGQLICVGSSEFLKYCYQTGYTLTIEKKTNDHSVFTEWFEKNGMSPQISKITDDIIEYQLSSEGLSIISKFEMDQELKSNYESFSINENGLDAIFSSYELCGKENLGLGTEDGEKLLQYANSFQNPSIAHKTWCFFKFEVQRTFSRIFQIMLRMTISFILLAVLISIFYSYNSRKELKSNSIALDSSFISKLLLPGEVIKTNLDFLVGSNSRFVPLNSTLDSEIGTVYRNTTDLLVVDRGKIGASLLFILNSLRNVTVNLEYISLGNDKSLNVEVSDIVLVAILLTQIHADLTQMLTDEIVESREKIKFLILAAGVPLSSYWVVTIAKNLMLISPFIVALSAIMPAGFTLNYGFMILYLLQPLFLSAIIGSLFDKKMAKGISQIIGIGPLYLMLIIVLPIVLTTSVTSELISTVGDILVYLGPPAPFALILYLIAGKTGVNASFSLGACLYLSVFMILFTMVDISHLFIRRIEPKNDAYVSIHCSKQFGKNKNAKLAVKNLNMLVNKEEVFALLGPNGCGKTTTLSMLTGQQRPTSGFIHIDDLHVETEKLKVISMIGYCPQFDDLLISHMTVYDHLNMFCSMNGMSLDPANEYIDLLLYLYGISQYKHSACGNLSGGTKRKVSVIIATMLPRNLVVLDEASTGLDPLARRTMWNAVKLLNNHRTTIITTHYVNETKFCDRIGIMTKGKLRSCGTEHTLIKNHGKGYRLTVKLTHPSIKIVDFIRSHIITEPESDFTIESVVDNVAIFYCKTFGTSVGQMIERMKNLKDAYLLEDFAIGQIQLEDVFLDVVKKSCGTKEKKRQ